MGRFSTAYGDESSKNNEGKREHEEVFCAPGWVTYIAAKGPRPGCRRRVLGGKVECPEGDAKIEVAEDELNSVFGSASYD